MACSVAVFLDQGAGRPLWCPAAPNNKWNSLRSAGFQAQGPPEAEDRVQQLAGGVGKLLIKGGGAAWGSAPADEAPTVRFELKALFLGVFGDKHMHRPDRWFVDIPPPPGGQQRAFLAEGLGLYE